MAKRTLRRALSGTLLATTALAPIAAVLLASPAHAGQLPASAFQTYNPTTASSITPGPFALYLVTASSLHPTQTAEGAQEVGKKAAGWDLLYQAGLTKAQQQAALTSTLLTDIEPVVIGPGGQLYLTDGHHTFTALDDSVLGSSTQVYVNVIGNYSNLTQAQFLQQLQSNNQLLPISNGLPQIVNFATGSPIPTSLTSLSNDPYRGLEYSILKQKGSRLFTTANNLTGAVGSKIPGVDKTALYYSDFINAAAYRNARGGLGLPYLSPGDVALATQWQLTGTNTTTIPNYSYSNVGGVQTLTANAPITYTTSQLPGYILPTNGSIVVTAPVTDAQLQTTVNGVTTYHVLDGSVTGTTATPSYNGFLNMNLGNVTVGNSIAGTVAPAYGFIMQLGADNGSTVTLQSTANTYTGGTTIMAGTLVIMGDGSLGAAPPSSYNPASFNPGTDIVGNLRLANGVLFDSLSEGAGTLTLGGNLTTTRPIGVSQETAILNVAKFNATLNGPLVSFGSGAVGLGNATGPSDLSIQGNATSDLVTLNANSPLFYGNLIVSSGTLAAVSSLALGNDSGPAYTIGNLQLDGGNFKSLGNFSTAHAITVSSNGSVFDTDGTTTSFAGLTDVQRTVTFGNSIAGSIGGITLGSLEAGSIASLTVGQSGGGTTALTVNSFIRDPGAVLSVTLAGGGSLLSPVGTASLTNGILPAWVFANSGASNNPYDFTTYGSNGLATFANYVAPTAASATSVVKATANATISQDSAAFALNVQKGVTITLGSTNTLTLGDGTNPAGLIMQGGTITGGTLAFGGSEGLIIDNGNNTIGSTITGTGGLTLAGSGTVILASSNTGAVTVDSGTLSLNSVNALASASSVLLQDTKKPTTAVLTVQANNQIQSLNSAGNNSSVNITSGAVLTIGGSANLNSTLSSAITETGAATAGALTKAGTGLLDLSGQSKGTLTLVNGSTIAVNGGVLRLTAAALTNATNITTAAGTEVQFAEGGGSVMAGSISGGGAVHLIGGTLQLTGTANSYTGNTIVEQGSVLDLTTANVSTGNANIANAGGEIVFDQSISGTFSGVISDAAQMEGATSSTTLAGTFVKDDSTGNNGGNVTLSAQQTYSGMTYVEAGTLTLGATNTIASSAGVDLGRIGFSATANLALTADNTIQSLTNELSNTALGIANTDAVQLGGHTLTLGTTASNANSTFSGTISGGALATAGSGTATLSGTNTLTSLTVTGGLTNLTGATTLASTSGSALTVTGGTALLSGTMTYSAPSGTPVATIGTAGTLQGTVANLPTSILDNGTVIIDSGASNVSYGGIISGTGGLTKIGASTLTITGAETYTGATIVSNGVLALGTGGSLKSTVQVTGGSFNAGSSAVNLSSVSGGVTNVTSGSVQTVSGSGVLNVGGNASVGSVTGGVVMVNSGGTPTIASVTGGSVAVSAGGSANITSATAGGITVASGAGATIGQLGGTGTLGVTGSTVNVTDLNTSGALTLASNATINTGGAAGTTDTFSGTVSGSGTFNKTGGGTLLLNNATVSVPVTVAAGQLSDNGTINGNVTIGSSGTLRGTGTINGSATVSGTLAPGNSPGTLTVNGSITQSASSTLEIDIDGTGTGTGAGNYSSVVVTGSGNTYTAAGTLLPKLRGITGSATNTYTPSLGQAFTIVTAAGGVSGQFATVTEPGTAGGLAANTQFDTVYGSNAVTLFVTPISYAALSTNGVSLGANQVNAGRALDALRLQANAQPSGDAATVMAQAYTLSAGGIANALKSVGGGTNAQADSLGSQWFDTVQGLLSDRLDNLRDGAAGGVSQTASAGGSGLPQLASASTNSKNVSSLVQFASSADPYTMAGPAVNGLWARAIGGFGSVANDGNASGYHTETVGGLVGYDRTLNPNLVVGGAFGVGHTEMTSSAADTTSYEFHGYGSWTQGPFFVDGNFGFGHADYDTKRAISFGTLARTASGDADGWNVMGGLKGGYRFSYAGVGIEPSAGLEWDRIDRGAYAETGAGVLDLAVTEQVHNIVRSALGVRGSTRLGNWAMLSASAAWKHDLTSPIFETTTQLAGTSFLNTSNRIGRDAAVVGLEAAATLSRSAKFFVQYGGEMRSHADAQTLSVGFKLAW